MIAEWPGLSGNLAQLKRANTQHVMFDIFTGVKIGIVALWVLTQHHLISNYVTGKLIIAILVVKFLLRRLRLFISV